MRYLLDTNMVSDLVRHPQGQVTQAIREVGESQVCTSIIVAAEFGGQQAGSYVHEGCPIHLPFNVPFIGNEIAVANLLPYIPAIIGLLWVGRWLEKHSRPEERTAP